MQPPRCQWCGRTFDRDPFEYLMHLKNCSPYQAEKRAEQQEAENQRMDRAGRCGDVEILDKGDGTFLVCRAGDDILSTHWHVAEDGTVLSIKEGNTYRYNRRQIRRDIRDVTGLDIDLRWQRPDY